MSNQQRIGLVVAALVVAVAAFLIVKPAGDEDESTSERPSATAPQTDTSAGGGQTETSTPEARPAPPEVARIELTGGSVEGGPRTIQASNGERVRIIVSSDASDEIHLHGYDLTRTASPGRPASFRFRAKIEGEFEIESHTAEDAGKDPLVARLRVTPD